MVNFGAEFPWLPKEGFLKTAAAFNAVAVFLIGAIMLRGRVEKRKTGSLEAASGAGGSDPFAGDRKKNKRAKVDAGKKNKSKGGKAGKKGGKSKKRGTSAASKSAEIGKKSAGGTSSNWKQFILSRTGLGEQGQKGQQGQSISNGFLPNTGSGAGNSRGRSAAGGGGKPKNSAADGDGEVVLVRLEELIEPSDNFDVTKYIALDCEMVGVGDDGKRSALAMVSIVNYHGNPIYQKYVKVRERVTDYRTAVSGITPKCLRGAPSFQTVQREVADMLKGRVLVGHGLSNDLKALMLTHPPWLTRDTAVWKVLKNQRGRPQKLKTLARKHLGAVIQEGEHSPTEDSQAALLVFKKFKRQWESSIKTHK